MRTGRNAIVPVSNAELLEELGVAARIGDEILTTEHAYPDRTVRLHFQRAEIDSEPRPLLGQEIRWVSRDELGQLQFPEADRELIASCRRLTPDRRSERLRCRRPVISPASGPRSPFRRL